MMGNRIFNRIHRLSLTRPGRAAVMYMLISTASFSAMNVMVRLASAQMEATQIMTLRNALTLVLLLPFILRAGVGILHTHRLREHVWRSGIGAFGMMTWTYCLTVMPLTHATALSFTAPLLVTLFAILVLKEKAHMQQWLGLAMGLAGTLIILRPSVEGFAWNSLLVLVATSAWAMVSVFVKSLSRTEPPLRMVFYMNLFMFLIALPFSLGHWVLPAFSGWVILVLMAGLSVVMHFTMVKAYALAPVVTLMPLDFMRMVYTAILAYLFFGETSDQMTWIGAGVIIASAVYLSRSAPKPLSGGQVVG